MKCLETKKICNEYNKKCKKCELEDKRKAYGMTDYEEYMRENKAKEIFENAIPNECKKCTLLERDFRHRKVKCLYRSRNGCMYK